MRGVTEEALGAKNRGHSLIMNGFHARLPRHYCCSCPPADISELAER